ncbi:MAG: response regulator, partial [Desulfovibrionaceae bacterium]
MPGFIKLRIAHKLSLLLFLFSAVAAGLTFLVCYQAASDQVMIDIQSRLRDIVSVSAQGVDMEDLARLKADPRIHTLPFRAVRQELARLRDATAEVKYTYVLVRDPDGTIRFLVDAEENPNDFIGPMRRYDDASAFLRARFDTLDGPVVENDFYTDEWGTWLSGYAPLHDADGHLTAVLGMDISATKVLAHRRNLRNRTLQLLGVALPIMLAVGLIVGRRAAAPIVAMKAGAERIGQGDLDLRLPVRSGDEVGVLSTALNRMASNLKANRARIEEIAASYRDIFDNAAEAIFQTTLQGRFITANIAAARMFGYETVEELLAGVNDLGGQLYVDAGDRRAFLDGLREAGRVDGLAVRFRRRDGDEIWAELSAHLTKTRSGESVIEGMALDVTARREREESERQCRAAEAASKAKSEFLANMSHEIRTPLNAVMGLTDLMLRTQMTDKQSQYLKKIKSSSQTLLAVINDILDFSKIEAGRLELEATQFSLYEVMANLSEMFSQKAHEKDLELLVSIADGLPNALVGDPVRLGQILINLVGNALKFTEKGEVVLAVEPAPKDEGRAALEQGKVMLEFSVRDTGIGIAADRVNSVFDSFTQEDSSTTRRFGGTGLGLSICKQLAGLMGGGIGVESEHGKGSRFHFTAVFGIQPESRQLRTQVPRDLRGLRVLVVDDNHTARDILEASIESFGMHADAVGSGLEALQKIGVADPPYDLILLDWKMPGLNGIETARGIKHDLKLTKTPIVCMISAYGREDLIQPTEKALLDAFLHKPVNQSFLFDTIMELFGRGDRVPLSGAGGGDEPPRPAACLAGVRVLLADDNEINREVAQEWLQTAGMVVSLVTNGREALEALGPGVLPDMVLMDIQMPEMDGLEATRRIRQDLGLVGLPVIAMTAHALKGDRERCLEAGMNDYVTKPI